VRTAADLALASSSFAGELPEADRRRLTGIAVTRRYRKDQILFTDGELCAGLFLLTLGRVKLFRLSSDGRERVIHLVEPGQSFAEAALFGDGRYPVSAQAIAPATVVLLPREPLVRMLREDPGLAFRMLGSMAVHLKRFVHQVEDLTFQSAAQRLAYHVLSSAGPGGRSARLTLPKKDVAGHLGMTPETFSRILASFRAQGVVEVRGSVIAIHDTQGLQSVAAGRRLPPQEGGGRPA